MKFVAPNTLENDKVVLRIIEPTDFDTLYQVAKDPLIWEQHPNKDRWKEEVFQGFFEGALESKAAYLILIRKVEPALGAPGTMDLMRRKNLFLLDIRFMPVRIGGQELIPWSKR